MRTLALQIGMTTDRSTRRVTGLIASMIVKRIAAWTKCRDAWAKLFWCLARPVDCSSWMTENKRQECTANHAWIHSSNAFHAFHKEHWQFTERKHFLNVEAACLSSLKTNSSIHSAPLCSRLASPSEHWSETWLHPSCSCSPPRACINLAIKSIFKF